MLMKTAKELYEEISVSEELGGMIAKLGNEEELKSFLKDHDCSASVEEFMKYVLSQNEGEISEDEVEAVAGGGRLYDMRRLMEIIAWSKEVAASRPRVPRDPSADLGHPM